MPDVWTMKQLERQIGEALKNPHLQERFSNGLENILFVWSALLQTRAAPGWLTRVHDQSGKRLFTEEETRELEPQLQPLATAVLRLVNEEETDEPPAQTQPHTQTGGGESMGIDEAVELFLSTLFKLRRLE